MKLEYNKRGNFNIPTQLAVIEELKIWLNEAKEKRNDWCFLCNQFNSITFFESIKKFPLLLKTINKYRKSPCGAIGAFNFKGHNHWSIRMKVLNEVQSKIKVKK